MGCLFCEGVTVCGQAPERWRAVRDGELARSGEPLATGDGRRRFRGTASHNYSLRLPGLRLLWKGKNFRKTVVVALSPLTDGRFCPIYFEPLPARRCSHISPSHLPRLPPCVASRRPSVC